MNVIIWAFCAFLLCRKNHNFEVRFCVPKSWQHFTPMWRRWVGRRLVLCYTAIWPVNLFDTLIWSGRGVSLHPFKNFTFIYTDNNLWSEWVRHLRPMLLFLLSLLLPLVHDTFSVSLRWGCYATHPSFPDKWSYSIQLLLTACQSQIKMAFVQWIRSKRYFLLLKFLTWERASFG